MAFVQWDLPCQQLITAQLVNPNQKIVAMCGDGGFLMNIQELETAVRLCLPLIVIIWCDYDYGMISFKQIHEFGRSAFTKFNNPNFAKLAESFGAIGYNIKSTKEFSLVLKEAVKSKSIPVIISVDVDYSRNRVLLDDRLCNIVYLRMSASFIESNSELSAFQKSKVDKNCLGYRCPREAFALNASSKMIHNSEQ